MALDDHPRLADAHRRITQAADILSDEATRAGTDTGRISLYNARLEAITAAGWIEQAAKAEERGQ